MSQRLIVVSVGGGPRAEGTHMVVMDEGVLLPCILSDEVGHDGRRWWR
jgi:hypothetical protein